MTKVQGSSPPEPAPLPAPELPPAEDPVPLQDHAAPALPATGATASQAAFCALQWEMGILGILHVEPKQSL